MRRTYITGMAVVALTGLAVIALQVRSRDNSACDATEVTKLAPSGKFRAQMTNESCGWGFGLAANNVTVKIEKLGEGGWFYILPLEYDGFVQDEGRPSPTIEWRGPSSLEIRVYTRDISGTLMRRDQELTVVRSYVAKEPT